MGAKLKLGHERRQTDCIQLRPLKSDKKAKQLLIAKNTKNNCKSSPLAHSEILPDFWKISFGHLLVIEADIFPSWKHGASLLTSLIEIL